MTVWQDDSSSLVRTALREWSDSLVNLTGRTGCSGCGRAGPGQSRSSGRLPGEILSGLVARRTWRFRSIDPARAADGADREPFPPAAPDVLDTRKPETDLGAALRNLARRSTQEFLNRGLSVVYVAIGLLDWLDDNGTGMASPLLLVPVELVRKGPRQLPILEVGEEDAVVNPALTRRRPAQGHTGARDLCRLRRKGLIVRIPGSNRYQGAGKKRVTRAG